MTQDVRVNPAPLQYVAVGTEPQKPDSFAYLITKVASNCARMF